MKTLEQNTSMW